MRRTWEEDQEAQLRLAITLCGLFVVEECGMQQTQANVRRESARKGTRRKIAEGTVGRLRGRNGRRRKVKHNGRHFPNCRCGGQRLV